MKFKNIATAFRVKRNSLGFSRIEMAEYLDISVSYVKKIELGQVKPGASIAETLDHAIDALANEKKGMTRKHAVHLLETLEPGEQILTQNAAVSKLTMAELVEIETKKGK